MAIFPPTYVVQAPTMFTGGIDRRPRSGGMSFAAVVSEIDFTERLCRIGMAAATFVNHADLAITREGQSVSFGWIVFYLIFFFTLPPFWLGWEMCIPAQRGEYKSRYYKTSLEQCIYGSVQPRFVAFARPSEEPFHEGRSLSEACRCISQN